MKKVSGIFPTLYLKSPVDEASSLRETNSFVGWGGKPKALVAATK